MLSPAQSAAITEVLDYQGYLTTPAGAPVNGVQTLRVALLLDGGSTGGNAFPAGLFEQSLWAGIKIGADAEMSPQHPAERRALQLQGS